MSVPTPPGYSQNGGGSVPTGSPNILSLGTQAQAAAATKIDWAGISAGTALTPDVSLPGGAWPSFANPSSYPVIYASGDLSLPGSGQGILIVTGNLTINGALQWNGIILVGGSITSNGNNTVNGAVMTGLNVLLGQTPGVEAVGNGNKTFRYNSCEVAKAMASFGGLVPYSNAWVDDWATF